MTDTYEDILFLPHPISGKRKRMSLSGRAAQFAPFAALSGFAAAITEAGCQNTAVAESHSFTREEWEQLIGFETSESDSSPSP